MKKLRSVTFIVVIILIFAMLLSSCKNQNKSSVSSDIVSSEITSSDIASSEPENEKEPESSKPENSSKPEISSKPKETSKHNSSKNNTSSNSLSNITIIPPFPRPQKEQTVSSVPENDIDELNSYFATDSQPETELAKHKRLIVGVWDFDLDLTPSLIAMGYDVKEPIVMSHCYVFKERTYNVTVFNKQEYYDKIGPYAIPDIEAQLKKELKKNKITESDFRNIMGMSVSKYAAKLFAEECRTLSYASGSYFFKDGLLYLRNPATETFDKCTYAFIDDDTLVITYTEGSITVRRHKEENTVTSE